MGQDFENPWCKTRGKGNPIMMSSVLNSGVFPGMQGGPLEHVIAAKAVAFQEALQESFKTYTTQVIKNAQTVANGLVSLGYEIISGGTDNHLMLIDLRNKNVTGKDAEKALGVADITINKNMVPFDDKSPFVTSGIRLGTAAITTRGLMESDCQKIVEWVDSAIINWENETILKNIRKEVNQKMSQFPLFQDAYSSTTV